MYIGNRRKHKRVELKLLIVVDNNGNFRMVQKKRVTVEKLRLDKTKKIKGMKGND